MNARMEVIYASITVRTVLAVTTVPVYQATLWHTIDEIVLVRIQKKIC